MARLAYIVFIALALLSGSALAYDNPVIVDDANLLDGEQLVRIEKMLEDMNSTNDYLLVLLTVPTIEGQKIESYSRAIVRVWGIRSREDANDGVLILIVRDTKTVHFTVGEDAKIDEELLAFVKTEYLQPAFETREHYDALQNSLIVLQEGIPGESKTPVIWLALAGLVVIVFVYSNTLNRRKRTCPHCKSAIPPIVSRCPKCLGDLRPWAIGGAISADEPDVILDSSDLHRIQSLRWLDLRFLMWQSTSFGGFTAGGPGKLPPKKPDRKPYDGPVMIGGF